MRIGRRRRKQHAADLEQATGALERAKKAVTVSKGELAEQRVKLARANAVKRRLERLAGSDSNHLGALVLQALTERYGDTEDQEGA